MCEYGSCVWTVCVLYLNVLTVWVYRDRMCGLCLSCTWTKTSPSDPLHSEIRGGPCFETVQKPIWHKSLKLLDNSKESVITSVLSSEVTSTLFLITGLKQAYYACLWLWEDRLSPAPWRCKEIIGMQIISMLINNGIFLYGVHWNFRYSMTALSSRKKIILIWTNSEMSWS